MDALHPINLLTMQQVPIVYLIALLVAVGLAGSFMLRYIFFSRPAIKALLHQIEVNQKLIDKKLHEKDDD